MKEIFANIYRYIFSREVFYSFNKLLFNASLNGIGVMNFKNDQMSGENYFIKKYFSDKSKKVVIDVGANVGNYSKKILSVSPDSTIYALEPHPKNYNKLVKNIISSTFVPFNLAAGRNQEELILYDYEDDDGSSHASIYSDVLHSIHQRKSVEHKINCVKLADFIHENNISSVDLLKIDTEGNELNVLLGLEEYLTSGSVRAIQFEFNEMNVASRVFFKDFWDILKHYKIYRLLPNGMSEIKSYKPIHCEIFAYQNIIAFWREDEMVT